MEEITTRKAIQELITLKQEAIATLKQEILDLNRQSALLCDNKQWFIEKMEESTFRENRKKVTVQRLVGRVHWVSHFKDEGTGEIFPIERSQIVRVDGNWNI